MTNSILEDEPSAKFIFEKLLKSLYFQTFSKFYEGFVELTRLLSNSSVVSMAFLLLEQQETNYSILPSCKIKTCVLLSLILEQKLTTQVTFQITKKMLL